jgi:aminoglycoside 6-adenylyltransferase
MNYPQLEAAILAWCQSEPTILAAVIVGSRARTKPPPDEWADLDLIVFTTTPAAFAASPAWINNLGPAWLTHLDPTGAGDPEWFALFDDGLKADFVLVRAAPAAADLSELIAATPYRTVFHRGVRVLYDGLSPSPAPLRLPPTQAPDRPNSEQFTHHIEATFFAINKAARLLVRSDLWRAQQSVNCALKGRLLTILEWHAHATAPAASPPDTWHDARHLAQWAPPEVVAALPQAFGHDTVPSLWSALTTTLDLYCSLARATATAWKYPYPTEAEAKLRDWLAQSPAVALNPHPH